MCVNDIIAAGAEPYFLDYVATGKNEPAKLGRRSLLVLKVVCKPGAALTGGKQLMPGICSEDDYDLAGFALSGVARRNLHNLD